MKIVKHLIFSTLIAVSLLSCSSEPKEFPVVDLYNVKGGLDLRFSDFATDIRIVPFETKDDLLFSFNANNGNLAASENYLVVVDNKSMNLFDRDGKHLRLLSISGNGPDEYNMTWDMKIDDKRGILYYVDNGDSEAIKRIDLKTGKHLPKIELDMKYASLKHIDENGMVYVGGSMFVFNFGGSDENKEKPKDSTMVFRYNPENEATTPIKASSELTKDTRDQSMFSYKNDLYILNRGYSDTLFKEKSGQLSPVMTLPILNTETDPLKGIERLSVLFKYKDGFYTQLLKQEMKTSTDKSGQITSISIWTLPVTHMIVKEDGVTEKIRSITLDPLDLRIGIKKSDEGEVKEDGEPNIGNTPNQSGQYLYYRIEAEDFIILAEKALSKGNLGEKWKAELEKILNQVDEDSNPLIIIGRIK